MNTKFKPNRLIDGFDLSQLVDNARAPLVSETKITQELDEIDLMIRDKKLPAHPEYLPVIMEELALHKFWKGLIASEDHHVFMPLATDRMLNFYEASVSTDIDIHSLRIGLIVAAMTSTINLKSRPPVFPTRYDPVPCFQTKNVDLSMFDLKCMEESQIQQAVDLIKAFAARLPNVKRMTPENRLVVYLVDAFRMWTVSKDKDLIEFMATPVNRRKFMKKEDCERLDIQNCLGNGGFVGYKPSMALTLFNTVWGRTKSFKYNIPAVVGALVANNN